MPSILHNKKFAKLFLYRLFIGNMIAFFLQFGGLTISLLVPQYSYIWFASGIACALCFLKGPRILPGIYLGSFLAYYLSNSPFWLSHLLALLNIIQAFLLLRLAYLHGDPLPFLLQKSSWIKFIINIAVVTAVISLVMVGLCYPYLQHLFLSPKVFFINWWLANFNGTIIFYSMMVTSDIYFPQFDLLSKKTKLVFGFHSLILLLLLLILVNMQQPLLIIALISIIIFFAYISLYFYKPYGLIFLIFLIAFFLGMASFAQAPIWQTSFAIETVFYLQLLLTIFTLFIMTSINLMNLVRTESNDFS